MSGHGDEATEVLAFWFSETQPRQVLLRDQFPRQVWRDTAMAFSGDRQALALSLQAVELGWLMPLMHSEDLTVQEAALPLCSSDLRACQQQVDGLRRSGHSA